MQESHGEEEELVEVDGRTELFGGRVLLEENGEVDFENDKEHMEEMILASQRRAIGALGEAEEQASSALQDLAVQNEQIDLMVASLDGMQNDMVQAERLLRRIASPFAFLFLSKEAKAFETVFGCPADWSGPLEKKRDFLPGYRTRFFAIAGQKMMYFDCEQHIVVEKLKDPRGEICLEKVSMEKNRSARTISLRVDEICWKLRCSNENEFLGWTAMIQKARDGKPLDRSKLRADVEGENLSVEFAFPGSSPPAAGNLTFEGDMDRNLDLILQKLQNLESMAHEQTNAINIQNRKLDVVHESTSKTSGNMIAIKKKNRRRLRDED